MSYKGSGKLCSSIHLRDEPNSKRRYLLEAHNGPRQNRTLQNMLENAIQAVGLQGSVIVYQQRFINLKSKS